MPPAASEDLASDSLSSLRPEVWIEQFAPELWVVEVEALAIEPVQVQDPLCTVVRGLLGERLRSMRCLTGAATCERCPETKACDYARVFDAGLHQPQGTVPPFWLQGVPARNAMDAGERLLARVVLLASEASLLPYVEVALREAITRLGRTRSELRKSSFVLRSERPRRWTPPAATTQTRWSFEAQTPLLLQDEPSDSQQACPDVPLVALLARAGARRLYRLVRTARGDGARVPAIALPDLRAVRCRFGRMVPWTGSRFSQRQEQRIPLEGLVGLVEAEGEALAELSPLLRLLPLVSVGKKTTHGFGHLRATTGE